MEVCHDGLKLWYGTEDAPASESFVAARQGISITVGVYPLHLANKVTVYYRSDKNRLVRSTTGVLCHSDYVTGKQYFSVHFPSLLEPQKVEYLVTLSCAGRQVPKVGNTQQFSSSFIINDSPSSLTSPQSTPKTPLHESLPHHRFPCSLNYLGTVQVRLQEPPDIIGETPEGLRVNWSIKTGQVNGPKLNAIFGSHGGDHMTIRHDGVGIVGAYATLQTVDGALIQTRYSGVFELGQKGYQNFLKQQWPNAPPLRVTPRFLTEHPQYQWLNRLQCIGIGEVQMSDLLVIYDLYAL
ncbi:DUF3237 domain-containing protein [Acaryochloris marina]|uniref:Uncharacterized protein n=1 Tax=Acaryochloris marina (strain MBIC 11017) TaxID=329726 RepID=B0BYJ2_ACAM1|nr:DUF3237 domain-containing protein [Acaryochloris marina]ABW25877.1 conserved hypothetical protein [Acaryochloris marina MBIC11017]